MDIQIELEDISTVKKKLKVQIPADKAHSEFSKIANEFKQHARLPGFRPGKAPLDLIKKRFAKDIRGEVIQKLVPDSYNNAIKEKGIEPLGEPHLENLVYEEGQPLTYEAHFEISPTVPVPAYKGIEVSVSHAAVSDEDVEKELERLREANAKLVPVEDRPAQDGDHVMIDLHGEYLVEEGHEHSHAHQAIDQENVQVDLGNETNHQAFNEALRGLNIAEERTFEVEYPADYQDKKLAGHRIRFTAEVTDIKKKVLPELNDEFAKDMGQENINALRQKTREDLAVLREKNRENDIKKELIRKLVAASSFDVPDVLIEDRVDDRLRDLAYNIAAQGINPGKANIDWAKVRADLRPEAEKDVRASLILGEVAKAEGIEVVDGDLDAEFAKMAESMNQPVEKVRQIYGKEGRMEGLREQLRKQRALDAVMREAQVVG